MTIDEDALTAAIDLIGRSGAVGAEVGYLDDDGPAAAARWYAQARYSGARIIEQDYPGPVEAAEALARRILDGGTCTHCGRIVTLGPAIGDVCRWERIGRTWERGCRDTAA